jgi:hypothetical protein
MFQLFEPTRRNRAHKLARWAAISMAWLTWALPFQAGTQEPAEDPVATQSPSSDSAVSNEVSESIDPAFKRMRLLDANIKRLEARLESADGMALKVLETPMCHK